MKKDKGKEVIVISKRVFKIKKNDKIIPLLTKLRKSAEKHKGFISRATYTNITDTGDHIVISEWKSEKQWQKWMSKKTVQSIQSKIDSLIGEKTIFDVYVAEKY